MNKFISKFLESFARILYQQTILLLGILFGIGTTVALWNMHHLSIHLVKSQALQNAVLYAEAVSQARTLYSSAVVDQLRTVEGVTITHDYGDREQAIPLPATYLIELGKLLSDDFTGMAVSLYSDYPFPWREAEGGPQDDFEREALIELRKNPQEKYVRFEDFQGKLALRYAQADIMQPSCIGCHNNHPDTPKNDWKVGDVRGVLEVTTPLEDLVEHSSEGLRETTVMLGIIGFLGISGIAVVIGRMLQTSRQLERSVIERTAQLREANQEIVLQREKSEQLLLNILPEIIAEQLKQGKSYIAKGFAEVTILFADIVGFTQISEQISPVELVNLLNEIFSIFDRETENYNLEKIKTIGDAYMVVGGLPTPRSDHAEAVAEMAIAMQAEIARFNTQHNFNLSIRIGINTGQVVAGVIGKKKFSYDLWGDAVNTASRMESHGIPGKIQVTAATYEKIKDLYHFECRGVIKIKGKGEMTTYLLQERKVSDR
ncbi:MAG: adenylate/guanylate cyclase domain-containing protein [Oscillatoria sp. PMC 1068.18]|nr:adenylate/guanylate cyclase domain-containing protein [Oscillatoria sp. PMC 1076.18]MEC4987607.1 adenylate/guanylate cyclase domain-containing protein [Oscillatoria sp. PMC 1068.18]